MIKICVVTGSRAEYGLMKRIIQKIEANQKFQQKLVVTGPHLSIEQGMTVNEITDDGTIIDRKIDIEVSGTDWDINNSIGLGVIKFGKYFKSEKIDILLVMGDRYEILSVAIAAFMAGIPVAHISGGELSSGSKDDVIRHLLTKLSSLHFVSAEEHRKRVIQLGENPDCVFNVGEPGLDDLRDIEYLSKGALEQLLDVTIDRKIIIGTFHPSGVNKSDENSANDVMPLLLSIKKFRDRLVFFSLPNGDVGRRHIYQDLIDFHEQNKDWFHILRPHGRDVYLSLVAISELVVGNSSSGLVEVPFMGVPSVNVGNRQKGRLSSLSVIHAENSQDSISAAIVTALSTDHQKKVSKGVSPYGNGTAVSKIVSILEKIEISKIKKRDFFDVNFDIDIRSQA